MNKGPYVGYILLHSRRSYLKPDGFFDADIKKARRFQSSDEALSATRIDPDMIVFYEHVRGN
jgi:hypothetical protein